MIQSFKGKEPQIGNQVFVAEGAMVIGEVELKDNATVWYNAVLRGDIEKIVVGEFSNIQECSVLHCDHGTPLMIGKNVTVGHNAVLHSCSIGDNSLIGMGAIVLNGAVIGNNCLIAAGAVITPRTVIPDGSLVMGSPAVVKRPLRENEIEGITKNAEEYITLGSIYLQENQ